MSTKVADSIGIPMVDLARLFRQELEPAVASN